MLDATLSYRRVRHSDLATVITGFQIAGTGSLKRNRGPWSGRHGSVVRGTWGHRRTRLISRIAIDTLRNSR